MIAARQIACGRSAAKKWVNPYITDGLIAMWDGEWNAGGGKHNPNATMWKDLTGKGSDWELNPNEGKFSIGIDYVELLKNISWTGTGYIATPSWSNDTDIKTLEGVLDTGLVETNNNDYSWAVIVAFDLHKKPGVYTNALVVDIASGIITHSLGIYLQNPFLPTERGQNSISCNSADMKYYMNGVEVINISKNDRRITSYSSSNCSLGIYSGPLAQHTKIKNLRIYSRALTADEIAHNYEIDKARFGL